MQRLESRPTGIQEDFREIIREEVFARKKRGFSTEDAIHDFLARFIQGQQFEIKEIQAKLYTQQKTIQKLTNEINRLTHEATQYSKQKSHIQDLLEQNEVSRKELEEIFKLDPDENVETTSLDGLLSKYVDLNENSAELVESVRHDS